MPASRGLPRRAATLDIDPRQRMRRPGVGHNEASSHHIRGVTYHENRSQVRARSGMRVMATLRNLARCFWGFPLPGLVSPCKSGACGHAPAHDGAPDEELNAAWIAATGLLQAV
jgi:hypothetical protein